MVTHLLRMQMRIWAHKDVSCCLLRNFLTKVLLNYTPPESGRDCRGLYQCSQPINNWAMGQTIRTHALYFLASYRNVLWDALISNHTLM